MQPPSELDDKANEWFNQYFDKLRFEQDYNIYPGESEPMLNSKGENIGIKIKREHVKIFATGITKLYRMIVLGEELPVVTYTPEEEAEFERKWNERYNKNAKGD